MAIEREQAIDVVEAFVSLMRVSRTIIHRDAEHSVSGTPVAILRSVRDRDADLRLGDLAERLRVKPSVASRASAALETEGLVERISDPDDARACRIHLTEAGRARIREHEDHVISLVAETFSDWSPAQIEQSVEMMRRLEDGVLDWIGESDRSASAEPDTSETSDPTMPEETLA
jgi:DNA-binding MarR family transcriptional regulator